MSDFSPKCWKPPCLIGVARAGTKMQGQEFRGDIELIHHSLRRRKKALPDDWVVLMEMVVRSVRYCAAGTWVHGGVLPASVEVVSSTQVGKVTGQDRVRTLFVRARVSCGFKGTCDRIRAL